MNRYILTADMGGTRIKLGLLKQGRILVRSVLDACSHKPIDWQMERLEEEMAALCLQSDVQRNEICGIGIAFPAIIDHLENRPTDYYGKYPGATEFDFNQWAQRAFSCLCIMENDARCALLGESRFGSGIGVDNLVMFTLGTGIGSALMEGSELTGGERGVSGNLLGHRPATGGETPCHCGRIGCAEAETSLAVMNRLIRQSPRISSSILGNYDKVDYRILFQCRGEGDPLAVEISDAVMDIWADAMIPAVTEFGAGKIIIGGGIMASGDVILPYMEKRLKYINSDISCCAALKGDDAALLGAGELVRAGNMKDIKRNSDFMLRPEIKVKGRDSECWGGYEAIAGQLKKALEPLRNEKTVVALESYPGVDASLGREIFERVEADLFLSSEDIFISQSRAEEMICRDLTDDRVRGSMNTWRLEEFVDHGRLADLRKKIDETKDGIIFIAGTGASMICEPQMLIYADLTRWEIQLRYRRRELANLFGDNYGEDALRMYKRAFFFDWRMGDRKKRELFDDVDFFIDANRTDIPVMVSSAAANAALDSSVSRPFRLVPYYDAGPWGGQWMREKFGLAGDADNFAWSFDGVPEENSLIFRFGDNTYEMPAINAVHMRSTALLGAKTEARFGAEFPIRFDMLDTMGGGNLSLQVHPTTDFIREAYGMSYTQDESYYILDADKDASVFLGVKEGTELPELIDALEQSQETGEPFDDDKYINRFPAKKHDHFMIPGGTIHCSGKNTMVLEISATPYIFTFKLWDWDRPGMDGRPRPVHIKEGARVIDISRDRDRILSDGFINPLEPVAEGPGWREERTGLHELEFIETRRHWFTEKVSHHTEGTVNVLNLVEGDEVIVESPTGAFEPMHIHYAETFIVPADAGAYSIRPADASKGKDFATIKAFVRGTRRKRREEA